MEPIIKRLKEDNEAASALSTYVIVMFGMIFIMYLFGYTSMYGAYAMTTIQTEGGNAFAITNPIVDWGVSILGMIASSLEAMLVVGA